MPPSRSRGLLLALVLPACRLDTYGLSGTTTTQTDPGLTGTPASTTSVTGSTGTTAGLTGEASTTDPSGPTTSKPDHGPSGDACDLFAPDCNDGEKCAAWSALGGMELDATKCVPETGAQPPGAACQLDGNFGDGMDDCIEGSICLDTGDSAPPVCYAYCSGPSGDPGCSPGQACAFPIGQSAPLCFPTCDPLVQDCSEYRVCVPADVEIGAEPFVCMPPIYTISTGTYGQPCEGTAGCTAGHACIIGASVPGCVFDHCCTPFCAVNLPSTCTDLDPALDCIEWFDQTPPEGYEDVGVCIFTG